MHKTLSALAVLAAIMSVSAAFAQTGTPTFSREPNLDRSGNDLSRDVLPSDATVEDCEARCRDNRDCAAFTFVKKSTTVPQPICWLKRTVPVGYPSECCISGVKGK